MLANGPHEQRGAEQGGDDPAPISTSGATSSTRSTRFVSCRRNSSTKTASSTDGLSVTVSILASILLGA
jgi:hypothetical protein